MDFSACSRYGTKDNFTLYKKDYVSLYIDTIQATLIVEETTRPFVPSSPSNGQDTEKEGWVAKDPYSEIYGDCEYYDGCIT